MSTEDQIGPQAYLGQDNWRDFQNCARLPRWGDRLRTAQQHQAFLFSYR